MVCRNEQRGKEAMENIIKATGNSNVQLKVCVTIDEYTSWTCNVLCMMCYNMMVSNNASYTDL